MKNILALSLLLCATAWLPALCQTPQTPVETDIAAIKTDIAIIKTDIAVIKTDIAVIKTDIAVIKTEIKNINEKIDDKFESFEKKFDGKFESLEKNFDRLNNIIIFCIGIPLAAIIVVGATLWGITASRRSRRDQTLEKQIETLTQEIEALKRQQIVRP